MKKKKEKWQTEIKYLLEVEIEKRYVMKKMKGMWQTKIKRDKEVEIEERGMT